MLTDVAPSPLSKSDFVRAQPADMPVKDVLAKAKEAGIVMTGALVRLARRRVGGTSKATSGEAEAPATPPAEKTASAPPTPKSAPKRAAKVQTVKTPVAGTPAPTTTKTSFILARPTLSPAEVVTAAKEAGLSVSPNYVSAIRSKNRATAKPAAASGLRAARFGDAAVAEFTELVITLGTSRAKELVDEVSRKLAALLDG